MPIRSVLSGLSVATMLALVASSPIVVQTSQSIGTTTLSNDELIALVETASQTGTVLELFCGFLPSVWEDSAGNVASLKNKGDGCASVKAQSCVSLCCYHTSAMSVCNRQDIDICVPYSDPPTLEDMATICDNSPFSKGTRFGWVKGGLSYAVACQ